MNDTTMKLLNLINEGKTVNEISEILKLSNKAIFSRLNNKIWCLWNGIST